MSKSTALPLAFLARMAALLDEEFPAFLVTLSQSPTPGLRVNTLKLTPAHFQALSPWELTPTPWLPEGFTLPRNTNAGLHPLHDAGLYYLQDPSAMSVAALLAPQPGERVCDLCAAPGGKTTHIAALMAGQGVLVANEINSRRARVLARNVTRWGARQVLVLNETPERLAKRWPGAFDRVLVDAPCSGEGMFRKNEQARHYWSAAHVAGCALRQKRIIEEAAALVRPGGVLVYATCTFSPEENEGVILRFIENHPDFRLQEPPRFAGFAAGQPEWGNWFSAPAATDGAQQRPLISATLRHTVRLWPHRAPGEGHFVAVLRRDGAEPARPWPLAEPAHLPAADRDALATFWRSLITLPQPQQLHVWAQEQGTAHVYAIPPDTPNLTGLRVVQPGWPLGALRRGRFRPDHGLALGLTAADVGRRLDDSSGSEVVARYLFGETLPAPGPAGWLLICVEGFPLGWGKRSGGVIKNHYPKELRWQRWDDRAA